MLSSSPVEEGLDYMDLGVKGLPISSNVSRIEKLMPLRRRPNSSKK